MDIMPDIVMLVAMGMVEAAVSALAAVVVLVVVAVVVVVVVGFRVWGLGPRASS